jgi:hypothetical protein
VTGKAAKVDEGEDVAEGVVGTESTTTDWVEIDWVRSVEVIAGVATDLEDEEREEEVDVVRGALLATTVSTVLVGITASR